MEAAVIHSHVGAHWVAAANRAVANTSAPNTVGRERVDHALYLMLVHDGNKVVVFGDFDVVVRHGSLFLGPPPRALEHLRGRRVGDEPLRLGLTLALLFALDQLVAVAALDGLLRARKLDASR